MPSRHNRLLIARITVSIAFLAGILSSVSWGQDNEFSENPDDLEFLLLETQQRADAIFSVDPLTPLHDVWEKVTRHSEVSFGLDLGTSYTMVYQRASSTVSGPRDASGGDLDFFGTWQMLESERFGPAQFYFHSETRDRLSAIPPASLNTGTVGGTILTFNSQDFSLVQFYWEQGEYENGYITRVGKMDPLLVYDTGRYVNPNYGFLNPTFSQTLPMPLAPAALGVVAVIYPTEESYILAGMHDANGQRTTVGFDTFFGDGEFFSAIEFGWLPKRDEPDEGVYHITLWHVDSRQKAGIASDQGIALTLEQQVGGQGNLVPFLRYAFAHRGLNGIRQNLSVGFAIENALCKNEDLIGFAFSWGEPSNRNLRDQYIVETFYRFYVTPHTQLTPGIQLIFDPANAPNQDVVTVFGLRFRTLF